jgi:hypothetical protein
MRNESCSSIFVCVTEPEQQASVEGTGGGRREEKDEKIEQVQLAKRGKYDSRQLLGFASVNRTESGGEGGGEKSNLALI